MSGAPARPARIPAATQLSLRHKRVQRLRRLIGRVSARRAEGAFVVEGSKLVSEALRAGVRLEAVYAASHTRDPAIDHAAAFGVRVFELAPGVLERVTDTVTPQPLVAVAPSLDRPLDDLRNAGFVVVCVDVRDPGNLGTVLRSAEASGAGGVICCDGTVDVYNPKCVRASAGSVFHVPLVAGGETSSVLAKLATWGMRRLGAAATGGTPYYEADLTAPTALVLGNEAHGLPEAMTGALDDFITIPMTGRSESLNVGMAAAVFCFEAARQRQR